MKKRKRIRKCQVKDNRARKGVGRKKQLHRKNEKFGNERKRKSHTTVGRL